MFCPLSFRFGGTDTRAAHWYWKNSFSTAQQISDNSCLMDGEIIMMLDCDLSIHSLNMHTFQLCQKTNEKMTMWDCAAYRNPHRLYITLTPGCQCILSSSALCPSHNTTVRLTVANMAPHCCPQCLVLSSICLPVHIHLSIHINIKQLGKEGFINSRVADIADIYNPLEAQCLCQL